MSTPTALPKRQTTLSDLYAERGLSDGQARRIVALLGLAQPQRSRRDADGPELDCRQLGA